MRLGIITCLWKRPKLADLMLRHIAALRPKGVDLVPVAAASRIDPHWKRTTSVPGWRYVLAPNRPLSNKFNAACGLLRDQDVDAAMILGSDDFIDEAFVEMICGHIKNHNYVAIQALYFFGAQSKEMIYAHADRVGGGRTVSRAVLERKDYSLWQPGVNIGIDGAMDQQLHMYTPKYVGDIRDGMLCAVKLMETTPTDSPHTRDNMWGLDKMKRRLDYETVPAEQVLPSHLDAKYAEALLSWS